MAEENSKTIEKITHPESADELLMATLELNPLNLTGFICKEMTASSPCKDVPVWNGLTTNDVYSAIISPEATDPRKDLKEVCVFVGAASAKTEPHQLMSYCVGENCAVKVCFDLAELKAHLLNPESLTDNGLRVNKWAKEMKNNKQIPEDIRLNIQAEMSEDWVQAIQCQLFAVAEKDTIKQNTEESIFNLAAEGLATYFLQNPWALSVGSFFSSLKGTATIMGWMKSTASSTHRLLAYIKRNAFITNLCVMISRIIRTCVCLLLTGATKETIISMFDHMLDLVKNNKLTNNVVVRFLLSIFKAITICWAKLAGSLSAGLFPAFVIYAWECVMDVFSTIAPVGPFSLYILNSLFSVLKFIFSKITGAQVESFFKCFSYVNLAAYTPLIVTKSLSPIVSSAFSRDLNFSIFILILHYFPVRFFAGGLVLLLHFGSKNKYIEKTVSFFKTTMEKYPKIQTVTQLVFFCLRTSSEPINVYKTIMEVYYWVFDLGYCFISKYIHPLKQKFYAFFKITAPSNEITSAACCFKGLTGDFLSVIISNAQLPKTGGGNASNTDLRLKHLILNTPIFSVLFMNKPVHFYLYRWNLEEGAKFGLALNTNAHIGLVAQEFEKHFPDHVTTLANGLRDLINLPCELQHILAGLNGTHVPKCQTRFKRLKSAQDSR